MNNHGKSNENSENQKPTAVGVPGLESPSTIRNSTTTPEVLLNTDDHNSYTQKRLREVASETIRARPTYYTTKYHTKSTPIQRYRNTEPDNQSPDTRQGIADYHTYCMKNSTETTAGTICTGPSTSNGANPDNTPPTTSWPPPNNHNAANELQSQGPTSNTTAPVDITHTMRSKTGSANASAGIAHAEPSRTSITTTKFEISSLTPTDITHVGPSAASSTRLSAGITHTVPGTSSTTPTVNITAPKGKTSPDPWAQFRLPPHGNRHENENTPAIQHQPKTNIPSEQQVPHSTPSIENTQNQRTSRQKWTAEETKTLLDGIRRHGTAHWTKIFDENREIFKDRDPAKIKDKFRNLIRRPGFEHFADDYDKNKRRRTKK